jgi:hypothetical protein
MFSRLGSSESLYQQENHGSATNNQVLIGDSALQALNKTPVQQVMNAAGNTASKIIEGTGDFITAPVVWLKDMQKNWLTYMIVVAVILFSSVILYCGICSYIHRKKSKGLGGNIVDLIKTMNNQAGNSQQPLPLSALNLSSIVTKSLSESTA